MIGLAVCYRHGGASVKARYERAELSDPDHPYVRFRVERDGGISADEVRRLGNDPHITDVREELAVARAMVAHELQREPSSRLIPALMDRITDLVLVHHKVEMENTLVKRSDVESLVDCVISAIETHVADEETRANIGRDIRMSIALM